MSVARVIRWSLAWLALLAVQLGAWALLAPRSFYDDFPGLGRSWVAVDGPFNEHLVRDVGALNLALAVLLIAAAIRLTRELVVVAGAASLVWSLPHLLYHLVNTDGLDGVDIVASLGGLALSVLLSIGIIATSRHLGGPGTAVSGAPS